MTTLTMPQKYYVLTIDSKGKIPKVLSKSGGIFIIACMLELYNKNIIKIEAKSYIKINKELPEKLNYQRSIYDYIEKKGIIKITALATKYAAPWENHIKILENDIVESLPDNIDADNIVEEIKKACLYDEEVTPETAALCLLLHHAGTLKSYFSEMETPKMLSKIEEFKNMPEYKEFISLKDAVISK